MYQHVDNIVQDLVVNSVALVTKQNITSTFADKGSLGKTESFNINHKTAKDEMDVEDLHSTELIIDFDAAVDSNTDDDDDDDNDASNAGINQTSVETSDDIPVSVSYDIKILPANNNEPDNNSNSYQCVEEHSKPTSVRRENDCEVDFTECLNSKVSHGSNNSEDIAAHVCDKKIKEEVLQICNLLPTFRYESVYKVLRKNYKAKNRVELSLWDLLPNKRPRVKHFEDSSVQSNCLKQNNEQPNSIVQTSQITNLQDKGASNDRDTVSNRTQNSETMQGSKKTVLRTNCENGLLDDSVGGGKVPSIAKGGILRPAKFQINQKSEHVPAHSSFVLHPPKLTNVTRNSRGHLTKNNDNPKEQMLSKYMQYLKYMQYVKQQKLNGGFTHFNFDKRNEMRRMFLKSDSSEPVRNQVFGGAGKKEMNKQTNWKNKEDAVKKNIVLPLQFQKMSRTLVVMFPQIDQYYIRQICRNLSQLEDTHSTKQLQTLVEHTLFAIIDFAKLFASVKGVRSSTANSIGRLTRGNTVKNILVHRSVKNSNVSFDAGAASTSSNAKSARKMNFDNTLNDIDNDLKVVISGAAYSVPGTNQEFGGARKKEMIQKGSSETSKNIEKKNIILPLKYQEMYETLALMFPQVDKNYIKQTCKNLSKLEDICTFEQLEILAEHTLQNKEVQSAQTDMKTFLLEDVENEQYTYLLGIFPNADPAYLRKVVARARDNPAEIINFIQTQWKQPTYPTKEETLQKMKITEQQKQYTKRFDVNKFLETFPDPFAYFTDPNRTCKSEPEAVDFLKSHFSHYEVFNLKHVYSLNNYNLTLTVQKLENLPPFKKLAQNVYSWEKCPPENIPLLQECAFILHRDEIEEHLVKLKEQETKEFEELKRKDLLLECQCCYDRECMPSKCSTCNDGHVFCNPCIIKGTESQLAQGIARISCFSDCDGEFTVPTLQKILPPTQFSIYIRKKQEVEVMAAGVEGLVSCPFCHFASIPPPDDKVFKCLNPECMKESCKLCKEPNHIPLRCYEERSDKARLLLEEKMTEALVRKCYKCGKPYYKEDGCNKITCACGAKMCYLCDIAIDGYSHFDNGRCPLTSDNYRINTETVREVAMRTMEQIKKDDPNVQFNTDDFLRHLPSTSGKAIANRVTKITNSKQ